MAEIADSLLKRISELNEINDIISPDVAKLISTVAVHRTEASRLAGLDLGQRRGDDFYKDRQNVGLWAKKQMQQRGIKPSSQFEEIVEKARTGKFLEEP